VHQTAKVAFLCPEIDLFYCISLSLTVLFLKAKNIYLLFSPLYDCTYIGKKDHSIPINLLVVANLAIQTVLSEVNSHCYFTILNHRKKGPV
jgi:hypothetical protein